MLLPKDGTFPLLCRFWHMMMTGGVTSSGAKHTYGYNRRRSLLTWLGIVEVGGQSHE